MSWPRADLPILKRLLAAADLLGSAPQLSAATAYVLAYEALFGQGLRQQGPAERTVMRARPALKQALEGLLREAGAKVRTGPRGRVSLAFGGIAVEEAAPCGWSCMAFQVLRAPNHVF